MKGLQLVEKIRTVENENSLPSKQTRIKHARIVTRVKSKAPASSNPEIPILCILFRNTEGLRTAEVLREITSKWYAKLNDEDRRARYPGSRQKIVSSVIKFSKKN